MSDHNDTSTLPLADLLEALGHRMEAYRISRQMKQEALAAKAGISARTLRRLETDGNGTLDTFARLLRALDIEHRLLDIVPDATLSPLDARGSRKPRQRVRDRADDPAQPDAPWTWDDEADSR